MAIIERRVAEGVFYGKISIGVESDLQRLTQVRARCSCGGNERGGCRDARRSGCHAAAGIPIGAGDMDAPATAEVLTERGEV